MKNTKRLLAIILSLVLICAALPLSFAGFAQTGNGYAFAEELGAELGKNLYDHNFSELSAVPSEWSAVSGSAALGTSEQGGITKSGYSISGANGSMNTVRIKIPAQDFVVKLSMYQVTSYWGGDGGRVYIYKHGTNTGNEQYFEAAQIQLGSYKRTSWLPPVNGAAIYKYDADGNTSNDTATRLEDIGGGFGTDGHSLNTLYIYSYEGTTYYVNEAGTLLGSSVDSKEFENNYITIAGDYIRILLSDFEAYELKKPSSLKGGYAYTEELGAELGKNLYDHNFSELSAVPSDWSVVSGSAALGTVEQGEITKTGYSISGANGNMNTVRIKVPAENFVAKLSMYQVTEYWGGDGGSVHIYKHGKNIGDDKYLPLSQIRIGGYSSTTWLTPANGGTIYKYDANGNTSNDTATRLEDIGGGFGTDGHSLNTVYIYSYNGTTYYVNDAGTLLGSTTDSNALDETYITVESDYMRILLNDFEVYEIEEPQNITGGYIYTQELEAKLGKKLYTHNFSELEDVPSDWSVVSGSAALGTVEQGEITKTGYSISGANGNMNTVRIKIPAKNFVAKFSAYQVTEYWGGDGGNFRIYKDGKNTGDTEYSTLAHIRLAGYASTTWLTPANGATIFKYDAEGNTSNDTATRLEDIGGGFGTDGHSLNTIYLYSYNGTTYYVNEAGTLLGSTEDSNTFDETYITIAGDYIRILLSNFEVYELKMITEEIAGIKAVKISESVGDNSSYRVNLNIKASETAKIGFFTADSDSPASIGYVEGKGKEIFTVNVGDTSAEAFITTDKNGSKDNAIGSDLYMYVIDGDVEVLNIKCITVQKLTNVWGKKELLANSGVSILKDATEDEDQAMRYYFRYDTLNGNDIVIDGEVYSVKSRGFLVTNGNVNNEAQITRATANGTTIKDLNSENLTSCWEITSNNDELNSSFITYSMYVKGFEAIDGTYNNRDSLYVKGYVVIEAGGVEYTIYGEESNYTVKDVIDLFGAENAVTESVTGKNRTLIWNNEFNTNNSFGDMKTFYNHAPTDERVIKTSENNNVSDGVLTMKITDNGDGTYSIPHDMTTKDIMSYKYGYLEMKAKVPYAEPFVPSFWLMPDQNIRKSAYNGEIDIFETFGNYSKFYNNLHIWTSDYSDSESLSSLKSQYHGSYTFKSFLFDKYSESNLNNDWHVYGFEWTETYMKFYIDGSLFHTIDLTKLSGEYEKYPDGVDAFNDFYYIILGDNTNADKLLSEGRGNATDYIVDYIRLYQLPESEFIQAY